MILLVKLVHYKNGRIQEIKAYSTASYFKKGQMFLIASAYFFIYKNELIRLNFVSVKLKLLYQ